MKNNMIPILKIGTYKDAEGKTIEITHQVLKDIVESYQTGSAPLVKGHPNTESPAVGWVEQLKIIGDKLFALFSGISSDFKVEIKNNEFKNISASFFLPDSPSNPCKGKYCLRHVGALGAVRPAIPNLGQLQDIMAFSEDEDNQVSFFSSYAYSFKDKFNLLKYSAIDFYHQELKQELEKAYQEISRLKEELAYKKLEESIKENINKMVSDYPISDDSIEKIKNQTFLLAKKGIDPKESIAMFSEFIEDNKTFYTHRFHSQTPELNKGTFNFSESTSIEETAVFADEVEKLYTSGMSRSDAYKKAKEILSVKR